jgi:hypothetical protein
MRALFVAVLGGGLLAACGGGGGPAPLPTPLAITAANQDAVARATANAVVALSGAGGGLTASDQPSPASVAAMPMPRRPASLAAAARHVARQFATDSVWAAKPVATAGSKQALAIQPEISLCGISGSVTLSAIDADNDGTLSIGDTLTFTFNACRDAGSATLNGSMAITLSRVDVNAGGFVSFNGSMTVTQLTVTDGARSASLDGNASMTFTADSATQQRVSLVVGGAGLRASVSESGVTETIAYDPAFSFNETDTFNAATGALESTASLVSGGFNATAISGRVLLETQAPIVQLSSETYPRSGTVRVVGTGSALRLGALDGTTVRIELDANGDGTYEASKDVAWSTLLPI